MKLYKATQIREIPDGYYWYRWTEEKLQKWDVMSIIQGNNQTSLYFPYPNETYLRPLDNVEERDDLIHYEFYGPIEEPNF